MIFYRPDQTLTNWKSLISKLEPYIHYFFKYDLNILIFWDFVDEKIGFSWKRCCCTEKKSQVLWGLWDAVWSVQWCRWWTPNKCCFYPVWNDLNDARNARPISKPSSQSTELLFWLWISISSAYRNLAILIFLKWSVLTKELWYQ